MTEKPPEPSRWRHILALALWLCLMPPLGLWKLWQDPTLSRDDKWRVLIYLGLLPVLVYVTLQLVLARRTMMRLDF